MHIITSGFLDEDYRKINDILCNNIVKVEYYPLEDYNIDLYGISDWRGSQIANAKLFFQDILKKNMFLIDNLLYLDGDTIIVGDLNSLEKFNEATIGAVKDHLSNGYFRNMGLNKYYNSGVLYVNTREWIENNCQNRLIDTLAKNTNEMIYPDQDLINLSLSSLITEMPQEYNMGPVSYLYREGFIGEKLFFNRRIRQVDVSDIQKAKENPKIYHAYGFANIKPWDNNNVNPYNEEFLKYILSVNQDFELADIEGFKRLLAKDKNLVRLAYLLKSYVPFGIRTGIKDVQKSLKNAKIYVKK